MVLFLSADMEISVLFEDRAEVDSDVQTRAVARLMTSQARGQQLLLQVIELTGLSRFRAEEILRNAQWQTK